MIFLKSKAERIKQILLKEGIDLATIDKFITWFFDNQNAWQAFKKFATQALLNNKKVGAKAVAERVRWETEIENNADYKVNNNYIAYMARLYNANVKNEYFKTREIKGLKEAA